MIRSSALVAPSAASLASTLRCLPGLVVCLALSIIAIGLGSRAWLVAHGFSALTIATVMGMLIANTVPSRWLAGTERGVAVSKQTLLRAGIVLYGVKLTLLDIGQVGLKGVFIDVAVLSTTFALAMLVGTRLLKMDRQTTVLIGAGSSICGAAAVLATQPVVRADADKVTVAIATVVIFGTLSIFLYPLLYHTGIVAVLPNGSHAFGVYEGSTIQEVAQVLAAAQSLGPQATNSAVIAKMVRVMMLAPFLIGLSTWLASSCAAERSAATPQRKHRLVVPWFAFLFIAAVVVNSFVRLAPEARSAISEVDLVMLGMAMGGVGLTTQAVSIRHAGFKPMILGAVLWAWLVCGGALINGIAMRSL